MKYIRLINAYLVAPYIAITGNGFGREHRLNNTIVYRLINTVAANDIALSINPKANRG